MASKSFISLHKITVIKPADIIQSSYTISPHVQSLVLSGTNNKVLDDQIFKCILIMFRFFGFHHRCNVASRHRVHVFSTLLNHFQLKWSGALSTDNTALVLTSPLFGTKLEFVAFYHLNRKNPTANKELSKPIHHHRTKTNPNSHNGALEHWFT